MYLDVKISREDPHWWSVLSHHSVRGRDPYRHPSGSMIATHSTWAVIGKTSKARILVTAKPECPTVPRSLASAAGSHATYAMAGGAREATSSITARLAPRARWIHHDHICSPGQPPQSAFDAISSQRHPITGVDQVVLGELDRRCIGVNAPDPTARVEERPGEEPDSAVEVEGAFTPSRDNAVEHRGHGPSRVF